MRALQQSTLLTLASRATTSHPSPASRAALLAPLYGVYNLQLEMDEAVLLFPCGMLAFYYLSKVCLGKCFASLWSGTASRLSGSFGSSKRLVAPDVNGLSGFDGLSAEEESIRQVARRPPRPLPPSRIYAPTRVAHPGDAPPRPAAPPPRPAAQRKQEARTRPAIPARATQERRRRSGSAPMSGSVPTTPRGTAGAHWHHKHHDWAASQAPSQLKMPIQGDESRMGSAPPSRLDPSKTVGAHRRGAVPRPGPHPPRAPDLAATLHLASASAATAAIAQTLRPWSPERTDLGAQEADRTKKKSHHNHTLGSETSGLIRLPEVPHAGPGATPPDSGSRWHQRHHYAGEGLGPSR